MRLAAGLTAVLLGAAGLVCAADTEEAALPEPEPPKVRSIRGEFRSLLPSHWIGRDSWTGPIPLYAFIGPARSEQAPTISVEKFTPRNKLYPTLEDFLLSMSGKGPMAMAPADRARAAGKVSLADRKVTVWERRFEESDWVPGMGEPSVWKVRERFAVLPRPDSFLVLKLRARAGEFEALQPEFDAFLKDFRPVPPKKKRPSKKKRRGRRQPPYSP